MTKTKVYIFFSDYFGVSRKTLESYGAFDISLVNDLPLFIDPFLIFNSKKRDYQKLHKQIIQYMNYLKTVSKNNPLSKGLIDLLFKFPEVKQNWLGFSKFGNGGRGLGKDFAQSLNSNLRIFPDFGHESVTQSSHLEKLCLLKEGVGRDNISDFTVNLIKGFLAEYTQKFALKYLQKEQRKDFSIDKVVFNYKTNSWVSSTFELPILNNDYILLTPKDILTKDETWINRPELIESFHSVAHALPNEALRTQVNRYLSQMLPAGSDVKKKDMQAAIAATLDKFPEILDYYILEKEKKSIQATSVANGRVKEVQTRFCEQLPILVTKLQQTDFYKSEGNTYEAAKKRVEFLKDVIENKGGHRIFYLDGKPIGSEEDLHIMYRMTWHATLHDVSREVNDGRGPADFKVSQGAADKTIVEFKLAKNSKLKQNLQKQAEVYEKASDATHPSIKAVLCFNDSEYQKVLNILRDLDLLKYKDKNIYLIDASSDNKMSASNA